MKRRRQRALQRDAHVLQHRQVRKYRGHLERAHDAAAGDLGGPVEGDVLAVVEDLAAVGNRNLVSRLKKVVLPAPFGPISAWICPAAHLQVDVAHRDEALELLRQAARLDDELVGYAVRRGRHRGWVPSAFRPAVYREW